jgi:hypothetical protein
MKKVMFAAVLAGALAGLGLSGCRTDAGEPDTWTRVTHADDLAGIWEGAGTIPIPEQTRELGLASITVAATEVDYTAVFEYTAGEPAADVEIHIDVTRSLDATVAAINANPLIAYGAAAYLGGSVSRDTLWALIGGSESQKYDFIVEQTPASDTLCSEYDISLDRSKTRMRIILTEAQIAEAASDAAAFGDIGLIGDMEVILEKQ